LQVDLLEMMIIGVVYYSGFVYRIAAYLLVLQGAVSSSLFLKDPLVHLVVAFFFSPRFSFLRATYLVNE
jgi:hypothetical protein